MAVYKVKVSERYKRLNPPKSMKEIFEMVVLHPDSIDEQNRIISKLESFDNWIEQNWYIDYLVDAGKASDIECDLDD